MALSAPAVFAGLLLLFVAALPLGLVLLRFAEWWAGRKFRLSPPERTVLAFFVTGGVLFGFASIPLPLYGVPLLTALVVAGTVLLVVLWWRESWSAARSAIAWLRTWPALLLVLGFLGLLAMEVVATGTHAFPNSTDGSFESLYAQLLIGHHTLPWTLEPYAAYGVVYPAGPAVWMSAPVLLFDWPIATGPVVMSTLFLSLSLVGAYCWGERLGGFASARGTETGLIFAAFFGLVAAWPRLFVGGSYDFAFCLPLFMVVVGLLVALASGPLPSWRVVVLSGGLLGLATALSVVVGETLFILLVVFGLFFHPRIRTEVLRWAARLLAMALIGIAFVVRSLVGIVEWYSYPGHELTAVGSPPYSPESVGPPPSIGSLGVDLNPFSVWKARVSPLPVLSLETQILLGLGLLCLVVWFLRPQSGIRQTLSRSFVGPVVLTVAVTFALTALLVVVAPTPLGETLVDPVTNWDDSSYLLFLCYQVVALVPLVVVVEFLRTPLRAVSTTSFAPGPTNEPTSRSLPRHSGASYRRRPLTVLLAVLLVLVFAVGAGVTVTSAPGYLSQHLESLANVTGGDVAGLQWAGVHLPACSRVLVAPASAAMFLPQFADVQLIFPIFPLSVNLSYDVAVTSLTHGVYTNATRSALLQLGTTEVFATAQTSVSYPALQVEPLSASSDFTVLFHAGDAWIFLFGPGASASECAVT